MLKSIVRELAKQWFGDYLRLVYWIARKRCRQLLDRRGANYSAGEIEELAQDAVCRAYDRFVKRNEREICGLSDRKKWVCQCTVAAARDAVRAKSTFGSISTETAVRDDVLNRRTRIVTGWIHGSDDERQDAIGQAIDKPVVYAVQRWELEQLIDRELPAHLRPTAVYAACGLTQEQSAILQGVTDRTIRLRLAEIRDYLCPPVNVYAVICSALQACMNGPRRERLAERQAGLFDRRAG